MSEKLDAILDRLKVLQRDLIAVIAGQEMLPTANLTRQVIELEKVIAAVEAVADDEEDREQQQSG